MKKGFTLVEVIAVVTILGVILLLISPNIIDSVRNSKKRAYERQILSIEQAAERWAVDNSHLITEDNYYLEISDLVDGDYLMSNEIIDARTSHTITGCIVIEHSNKFNQYSNTFSSVSCAKLEAQ